MRHVAVLAMLLVGMPFAARAQDIVVREDPRPPLLRQLDGEWSMTGDVLGKPVSYLLVAGPTLRARFSELHMRDVSDPPQYEARVFLGVDEETGRTGRVPGRVADADDGELQPLCLVDGHDLHRPGGNGPGLAVPHGHVAHFCYCSYK